MSQAKAAPIRVAILCMGGRAHFLGQVIASSPSRRGRMRPDKQLPRCHTERLDSSRCIAANDQRSISHWEFPGSGRLRVAACA